MSQFRQQPQQPQQADRLSQLVDAARQLAGNDPRSAVQAMADSGMTCNLPDGRTMSVADLLKMAEGKSAVQLMQELGLS